MTRLAADYVKGKGLAATDSALLKQRMLCAAQHELHAVPALALHARAVRTEDMHCWTHGPGWYTTQGRDTATPGATAHVAQDRSSDQIGAAVIHKHLGLRWRASPESLQSSSVLLLQAIAPSAGVPQSTPPALDTLAHTPSLLLHPPRPWLATSFSSRCSPRSAPAAARKASGPAPEGASWASHP